MVYCSSTSSSANLKATDCSSVAMVISALARGGGALALGVLLGTLLALLGAGRLWLARGGER